MSINNCKIIQLPKIPDERGNLTFIESEKHLPFTINRVYYLYDVPEGAERGGHAHKELHQLLICLSGKFQVKIDDGKNQKNICLNCPNQGLHIVPMIWRELFGFAENSVCLVLASDYYSEDDYYRNYEEFIRACRVR